MKAFYLILTMLLVCFRPAAAQVAKIDTAFLHTALARAENKITQTLGINSRLFNGVRYQDPTLSSEDKGQPYLLGTAWSKGEIAYDGGFFAGVDLNYNLVHDKLIIVNPWSGVKLQLINEKIEFFVIEGHRFERLDKNAFAASNLTSGFYEVLGKGHVGLYKRYSKSRQPIMTGRIVHNDFRESIDYFLLRNGSATTVNTRRAFLKGLSDQKIAIRRFISAHKLRFGKRHDASMAAILAHYNELSKP